MCGIAGYFEKSGKPARIGKIVLQMLEALGCRGPDSSGIALWNPHAHDEWIAQVKLGDTVSENQGASRAREVLQAAESVGSIVDIERVGAYLRLTCDASIDALAFTRAVELVGPEIEVVSLGKTLEIIKEVGTPKELDRVFDISGMKGTHALGHTRLSTESRIDLSHSQPFWAHGLPDVASVHNGHITNYHRLRRIYEGRGVRFYTENDSEIIGIYLRDRVESGDSFEEALNRAMHDFDGSYCFLAATPTQFALVKDGFGFKPLVVAESDDWVAVATEEIALRQALGNDFETLEPAARTIQVWNVPQLVMA